MRFCNFLFVVPVTTELPIQSLKVYAIGSYALYLVWKKPEQENDALTGYKIYYQKVEGTNVGPLMERKPNISDPIRLLARSCGGWSVVPSTGYKSSS